MCCSHTAGEFQPDHYVVICRARVVLHTAHERHAQTTHRRLTMGALLMRVGHETDFHELKIAKIKSRELNITAPPHAPRVPLTCCR